MPVAGLTSDRPQRLTAKRLDGASNARFVRLLLAVSVLDLWLPPLRSSFWLDETATFWVIKDGLANLVVRSMNWTGQSPLYYVLAWIALAIGGRHEWILRIPSFASLIIAAWLFHRTAARLFDSSTALFATLLFTCSEPIVYAASDARPYAFGLCMLMASALTLVRWLDQGRARYGIGYILFTALTIYTHYMFGPTVAVLAIYALARARTDRAVGLRHLLIAWTAVAFLLMPLVFQLKAFYQGRASHSFADAPALSDLFACLTPPALVSSLAVGFLVVWLLSLKIERTPLTHKASVLLSVGWAAAPPVLLYLISVLTPVKLFVPRYYVSYAPGLCLIAAWLVCTNTSALGQRITAVCVLVAAIVSFGSLHHGTENWARATETVRADAGGIPVLIASGFIEASDWRALDDPQLHDVLFAPQEMYPLGRPFIRLPYRLDEKSAKYVERFVPALRQEKRFLLIVRFQGLTFEPWLRGRLEADGFRSELFGNFGSLGVFLFRRD